MAEPLGFLEHKRQEVAHRPVEKRVADYFEVDVPLPSDVLIQQAGRCMDCGIPFCHGVGCPLANRIPEFNELVHLGRWREAFEVLDKTNNFPEITGRICPAPCEAACTLGVGDEPVLIKHIELQIIERAFAEGWIQPEPPVHKTHKRVAVVGSGPAGLATAQQLARAGHNVVVFEKDQRIGGLLRYGIPDFKLDKSVLDRRLEIMRAEGVEFRTGVVVGEDISGRYLRKMFDAICLTMGASQPRDLKVPGRGYENVVFAMDFLTQQNRLANDELDPNEKQITATDKTVIVVGGGDTGSDCVGTARRQGAKKIHQLEILPQPPVDRPDETPWPQWPRIIRTSSSHEEGCQRRWSVMTTKLSGTGVRVTQLHGQEVQWTAGAEGWKMEPVAGTDFTMDADLVILAMGFTHVAHSGLAENLGLKLDDRGNIAVKDCQTSQPGVFAAGDASTGASLVVRAIGSGRDAAAAIDKFLASKPQ